MEKRKKHIGLDFDDVLFSFNEGMATFHNEFYETSYCLKDITSFDLKELWQCDLAESLRRMREFVTSDYHDQAPTMAGAIEAVRYLKKEYNLSIVTARDTVLFEQTWKIANRYFPGCFNEIHFLHDNDQNVLGTKGDVCRRIGVDIMVEDSLGNAEHLSLSGVRTLLFDRPWNQATSLPIQVTRVLDWQHALSEIKKHFAKTKT